jgi:hypothetical protein
MKGMNEKGIVKRCRERFGVLEKPDEVLSRCGRGMVTSCKTSPPAAPLLAKERFMDAPVAFLTKERRGSGSGSSPWQGEVR